MKAGIDDAIQILSGLGAKLRTARLSPLSRWIACGRTIQRANLIRYERWLKQRPEDYCEISRRKLLAGAFIRAEEYIKALQTRRVLCAEFDELMQQFDAVITLSGLELPCRIDRPEDIGHTYERHVRMPFNITGTPAIAVPTGFSREGIPLGMQIAGRAFDEATVYRAAWAYCEATGSTSRVPPLTMQVRRVGVEDEAVV